MVRNAEGELLTPSVVLFDQSKVVVGKEARSTNTLLPDRVAEWVKRDMGSPVYSRPIGGQYLPPEVIQACILRKLKADLVEILGSEGRVVITVPAYFDEPRRKATADAGEMAGLSTLDIVNEPTAAALAFGETLGYLAAGGGSKEEMTVLAYDLGGGTFDVTLLKLAPGEVRALATDGDVQLGGHDWDMRLVDYLAESFKQLHGVDPREDPSSLSRLYNAAVEAKHTLSARSRATVRLQHDGLSEQVQITREQFEEMTTDLMERTAYTSRQLIADAGMEWKDVRRVLLVGGSTRMPMVRRMLQQLTGIAPDQTVNPDEAVARGAALYAHYLLEKEAAESPGPGFEVTNVNAHSLGVEGIDQQTLRKTNVVLIPRNTPLPAEFTEKFITRSEGQRSIVIQVLQGESSLPGECAAIGRTAIHDLPEGLPQGWPVEVTFQYETNGRLNVHAVVPGTSREVTLELERNVGLSRAGIAGWKQVVSSSAGFDAFGQVLEEVLGIERAEPQVADLSPPVDRPQAGAGYEETLPQSPGGQSASSSPGAAAEPTVAGSAPLPSDPPATIEHAAVGSRPVESALPATAAVPSGPPSETVEYLAAPQAIPCTDAAPPPPDGAGGESPRPLPASRLAIILIGYVSSSVVGLGAGYLVLHFLRPDKFPLPW